ncbi:MAG: hypothetical protein ACFFC7_12835 [Candidatus Hermodarchaeota archaeon]
MSEDIRSLKVRLMKAQGELQNYKNNNAALQARISELYQWTQSAQAALAEKDNQIAQLQQYIEKQSQKQDRSDVDYQELLHRHNRLEARVNSAEFLLNKVKGALFDALVNTDLAPSTGQVFEEILWQTGDTSHKVFVLFNRRRSAISIEELQRETQLNLQQVQEAVKFLLNQDIIKSFGRNVYILAKGSTVTSEFVAVSTSEQPQGEEAIWDSLSVEDLFISLEKRIHNAQSSIEISQNLTTLRDVLQRKFGNAIFLFEIARTAQEWERGQGNMGDLMQQLIDWRVETEKRVDY